MWKYSNIFLFYIKILLNHHNHLSINTYNICEFVICCCDFMLVKKYLLFYCWKLLQPQNPTPVNTVSTIYIFIININLDLHCNPKFLLKNHLLFLKSLQHEKRKQKINFGCHPYHYYAYQKMSLAKSLYGDDLTLHKKSFNVKHGAFKWVYPLAN